MTDPTAELRPQRSMFPDRDLLVRLDEYQHWTTLTDRNERAGIAGLGFVLLGLFGEVGSLLSELKKKQRDKDSYVAYQDTVIEELGDVLWYFANGADRAGLSLSSLAGRLTARLDNWDYHGRPAPKTFADLQAQQSSLTGPLSNETVERRLLLVAGKVGALVEDYSGGRIDANRDVLSGDLVEILRSLVAAADDASVSLNEAARRNLEKIFGRWPTQRRWPPHYDEHFDPDEQLPRRIVMMFKEKQVDGKHYVIQKCEGINIGDRLTDNRLEPDDYRFHDVFHLTNAAILGWSPVLRALFKVKRKSNPLVDEIQDGARAILIEEGIATWIFNHGARLQDFRNVKSLDYSLLKAIRELVKGYEVESRPLWQWEFAILEGFRIFREIRKPENRGGTVIADLLAHTITFETPT